MIGCVSPGNVGEARLHAHPDQRQQATLGPRVAGLELGRAQADTDLVVWVRRVWGRQMHCHVEVVATRFERGLEDRRIEARVAGVDDDVSARRGSEFDNIEACGCIDPCAADTVGMCRRRGTSRSGWIDVGDDDVFEGLAPGADGGERRPDSTAPTISTRMTRG